MSGTEPAFPVGLTVTAEDGILNATGDLVTGTTMITSSEPRAGASTTVYHIRDLNVLLFNCMLEESGPLNPMLVPTMMSMGPDLNKALIETPNNGAPSTTYMNLHTDPMVVRHADLVPVIYSNTGTTRSSWRCWS